jgi:hypothetical protein
MVINPAEGRLLALLGTVLAAIGLLGTLAAPAAAEVDSGTALGNNCYEFVAFPEVPYQRADDLVPDNYSVIADDKGTEDESDDTASLFITARRCDSLRVGDRTVSNLIDSYIAVPIRGPGSCDRLDPQDCAPGDPAPNESGFTPLDPHLSPIDELLPLETYLVQWVTNSHLRATWLKQGVGLDAGVTVIEGQNLAFNYDPVPGFVAGAVDPDFSARVPPPAPSPYTINAKVTEPGGVPIYAGQNQWWDTGDRTLIIFAEAPVSYFGLQEGGTITADDPNSPLGRSFGSERTRPTSPAPVDPFEFNFYEQGFWTKCVRNGEQHACEAVDDGDLLL